MNYFDHFYVPIKVSGPSERVDSVGHVQPLFSKAYKKLVFIMIRTIIAM